MFTQHTIEPSVEARPYFALNVLIQQLFPTFTQDSEIPEKLIAHKDILRIASTSDGMNKVKHFIGARAVREQIRPAFDEGIVHLISAQLRNDLHLDKSDTPLIRTDPLIAKSRVGYLMIIAKVFYVHGEHSLSSQFLIKAINIFTELQIIDDYIGRMLIILHRNLVVYYQSIKDLDEASGHLLDILETILELDHPTTDDYFDQARTYIELCHTTFALGDFEGCYNEGDAGIEAMARAPIPDSERDTKQQLLSSLHLEKARATLQMKDFTETVSCVNDGLKCIAAATQSETNLTQRALLNQQAAVAYFHLGDLLRARSHINAALLFHRSPRFHAANRKTALDELNFDDKWRRLIEKSTPIKALQRRKRSEFLATKLVEKLGLFHQEAETPQLIKYPHESDTEWMDESESERVFMDTDTVSLQATGTRFQT